MAKTTTNQTAGYTDSMQQAFQNMQSKFEVPAAARDFAKQAADTAGKRVVEMQDGMNVLAASSEKVASSFVSAHARLTSEIVGAAFANMHEMIAATSRIAEAKTMADALRIQADFVRDSATANVEHLRSQAELVQEIMTDGTETVRAETAKIARITKQAA